MTDLVTRIRHAWAVLTGRIALPTSIEGLKLMADLTNTTAAIARVSASASRLIAKSQTDDTALAEANTQLAQADSTIASQVNAIADQIDAVAPPGAVDPGVSTTVAP